MASRLGPLELHPVTREPFLRLRKHRNVIITPPRPTDAPNLVEPLNDERVHVWLIGPPHPYLLEHAEQFIAQIRPLCDDALQELSEGKTTLMHSPVRYIRELQEDGSDIFLGDLRFDRCVDVETIVENAKYGSTENASLEAGDADIVWTVGYFLVPSHHGQGIMSDAVETLIREIGVPYLGAQHIVGTVCIGNEGSRRVFEKNGFRLTGFLVEQRQHVFEWRVK